MQVIVALGVQTGPTVLAKAFAKGGDLAQRLLEIVGSDVGEVPQIGVAPLQFRRVTAQFVFDLGPFRGVHDGADNQQSTG